MSRCINRLWNPYRLVATCRGRGRDRTQGARTSDYVGAIHDGDTGRTPQAVPIVVCLRRVMTIAPGEGLGVDRGMDRSPWKSQCRACFPGIRAGASMLVKRPSHTSVLLLIYRSWIRAPPAPRGGFSASNHSDAGRGEWCRCTMHTPARGLAEATRWHRRPGRCRAVVSVERVVEQVGQ